jgi:hypothetical protein
MKGKYMGAKKNHAKIKAALESRIAATPNLPGFKKPGSLNRKKTGYARLGRGGK